MEDIYITLKGIRRKIKTKISHKRLCEVKHIAKNTNVRLKSFKPLNALQIVWHGGVKDSTNKNISKVFNNIKEKHKKRI